MFRNAIIGIVIGVVIGVVVGATVVAPRLNPEADKKTATLLPKAQVDFPLAEKAPENKAEKPAPKPESDKRHPPFPEQVDIPEAFPPSEGMPEGAEKPAEKTVESAEPVQETPAENQADASNPDANPGANPGAETKPPPAAVSSAEAGDSYTPVDVAAAPQPAPGPGEVPQAEPQVTRLKMASAYSSSLPQLGTMAKKLDRDIWRVSAGSLEIKFYEPGALVPPLEMFDAVRTGVIDAAFSSPGFWGNKVPALQLFAAVPFGPSAKEVLAWVYFGGGKELFDEIYHANGIHSVFCGLIAPEASGWFRNRIRTVEDLNGLKMRFFGLGAKVMQKLGVKTSQLSSGDIFLAFESGDIDAAEFSMPAIDLKLGFHRMAKNYYFPGWHQPSTLFELMINLEKWKALSTPAKAQIEAVCGDIIRYGLAEGEAVQYAALKELQSKGVIIRRWPGEILEALNKAWAEVAKEEAKADRNFKRVWKSLSAFRTDYAIWQELSLAD